MITQFPSPDQANPPKPSKLLKLRYFLTLVFLEIDPLNYVERLKAAEFQLAQAKLYLAEQTALAEQAKADWEKFDFG